MERIDPKYINIPNINFSLDYNKDNEEKYVQQRLERGFDDSETWSLDYTIASFILPRLKRFKEVTNGYPANFETFEEWIAVIDKIIKAFENKVNSDNLEWTEEIEAEINEGLTLFAKWFSHLWW